VPNIDEIGATMVDTASHTFRLGAEIARGNAVASDFISLRDLALWLSLIVASYALLIAANFHFVACIAAYFMISKAQLSLLLSGHEAIHYSLFRNKRLNDLVGAWLCFAPMGVGYNVARAAHLDHHRYLLTEQDAKLDHQIENPTRRRLTVRLLGPLFGLYLWKGLLRIVGLSWTSRAKPTFLVSASGRRADLASIVVSGLVMFASLTLLDWRLYPFFWLAPLFTVAAFFHNIKGLLDHVQLPGEPDDLLYSYRVTLLDRLFLPTQQARHAEHHLYPHVPYHRLQKIGPVVRRMSDVRERHGELASLLQYYRMLPR
jgi:fatty acid desaturase